MDKVEFNSIVSGSPAQVNANFDIIKNELDNKVLYRDNPDGEPNQMLSDLDLNGNRLLNLPAPINPTDPVRLVDLIDITIGGIEITPYILPVASTSVLGGVKAGTGVSIASDGTLSAVGALPTVSLTTDVPLSPASLVYIKPSGNLGLADAVAEGKEAVGVVLISSPAGASAKVYLIGSLISGLSGLTPGAFYYMSTTPGAIVPFSGAPTIAGNVLMKVGTALTSSSLVFSPEIPITL